MNPAPNLSLPSQSGDAKVSADERLILMLKALQDQLPDDLLNENEVVDYLRNFLGGEGYAEILPHYTTERGRDITATHLERNEELFVECKGETSSKDSTPLYTEGFKSGMVKDSVAKAVYTAMEQLSQPYTGPRKHRKVAVGFPDSRTYRKYVVPIKPMLDALQITVWLVRQKGTVTTL